MPRTNTTTTADSTTTTTETTAPETTVETTAPETTVAAEEIVPPLLNDDVPERIDPGHHSRDFSV